MSKMETIQPQIPGRKSSGTEIWLYLKRLSSFLASHADVLRPVTRVTFAWEATSFPEIEKFTNSFATGYLGRFKLAIFVEWKAPGIFLRAQNPQSHLRFFSGAWQLVPQLHANCTLTTEEHLGKSWIDGIPGNLPVLPIS